MGLIGSIVGGAMKIGASIFGGIKNAKAMRKVQANLEQQKQDNQDWFDRRYNEDSTQRADAQRLLTMTEESIKNRNKQAAGAAAVMGGTEESVAAAKAANNQALTDTMSNINAQADARKDTIEQTYQNNKSNIDAQLNDMTMKKAQNTAQAVQGVASAAGNIAGAF